MKGIIYADDGTYTVVDPRTLPEAKAQNVARIRLEAAARIEALVDGPQAQMLQWLALGALKDNAGVAFASWPAATRTAWTNNVDPVLTGIAAIRAARTTALAAINAATTNDGADAVIL